MSDSPTLLESEHAEQPTAIHNLIEAVSQVEQAYTAVIDEGVSDEECMELFGSAGELLENVLQEVKIWHEKSLCEYPDIVVENIQKVGVLINKEIVYLLKLKGYQDGIQTQDPKTQEIIVIWGEVPYTRDIYNDKWQAVLDFWQITLLKCVIPQATYSYEKDYITGVSLEQDDQYPEG